MRYSEIKEARRGGDSNPKVGEADIIKSLNSYSSKPNEYYYMSYTVIDKLGINPRSGYNTPIGIYSYPLTDTIMTNIENRGLDSGVPYMGDAPYIWLFKPKNVGNGLVLDEYEVSDFERDRDALFKYVSGRDDRINDVVFDRIVDYSINDSRFNTAAGHIWNLTRILGMILSGQLKLSRFLVDKQLEINDFVLYNDRIGIIVDIFYDEYNIEYEVEFADFSNEVFDIDKVTPMPEIGDQYSELFDKLKGLRHMQTFKYSDGIYGINELFPKYGVISLVDADRNRLFVTVDDFLMYNPSYGSKNIGLKFEVGDLVRLRNPKATPRHVIVGINEIDEIVLLGAVGIDKPPFKWPFSSLYKGNPELAPDVSESIILEYDPKSVKAKRTAVMWTYLLYRVLGYEYVDDSSGLGIIHNNEPVQAVFFGRQVIDVVERFVNPSRNDKMYDKKIYLNQVFSETKSVEDIEKLDQKLLNKLFMRYYKAKVKFSSTIPPKFRGHIVLNSSKLKAKLIVLDYGMLDYFKSVDRETIRIADNIVISKIFSIPSGNMEENKIYPILRHFIAFHKYNWPEGERAILKKADVDNNAALILEYIKNVRRKPWSEAEFIILKNPWSISSYAKDILKSRWPEGERVLRRIDSVRGKWILDLYADDFGISVSDIGNI